MQTYNLQKLEELLHDFYNLTHMKISIHDAEGEELCYYAEKFTAFCAALRQSPEMDSRCKECDVKAFSKCKQTRRQYVHTCHAGLLECFSPIIYDEKIIGYIALGQIKTAENADFSKIEKKFPEGDRVRLKEKFDSLPSIELEKIYSAMRIVDACAGYEYLKGLVNTEENKIDVTIGKYIEQNLSGDLSVQTLCSKFRLSHSEIYEIFHEYFQAPPAEYVKIRRLNKACDLLKSTKLPVNKIAERCGIPDYNYFSKVFKRQFALSPRDFRKQNL